MNQHSLRVLVVDDDEEDFLILRDLLADQQQGRFALDWVGTLAEGIAALRADEHDVYLVDYHLGPDNGMDLVRLAVAEQSAHRPVIMLTGQGNPDVDREALAAGASDYLIKGNIDAEKLARSLRYAAERARQVAQIEEGKKRYRQLFELNPFPIWVYDTETLRFVAANDAMVSQYGYDHEELRRMTILDIRDPDEAGKLRSYLAGRGDKAGSSGVWRHRRKDGTQVLAELSGHPIEIDGRPCRMVIAHDITAQRTAQERLLLLRRAVESSMNGIVITDALSPDLPIIYANQAFEALTGYSAEEVIGRNCRFLQGPETQQAELDILRRCVEEGGDCNVILRNFRKGGELFWNHLFISPVRDEDGVLTHFVGIINDLTERRQVESELAYAANHDAVTGLPRYPILETAIGSLLNREDAAVSVLFLDIDHFHAINESMGHVIGDEALRVISGRLRDVLGGPGLLARFAGDEFVAVVPDAPRERVLEIADALRQAVAKPLQGDGWSLYLTASIGIARSPLHGDLGTDLLRRAEAAMTRAKREGRDTVCEFSAAQMQELEDRLVLGARLREAVNRNELQLHYQPQLDSGSRRIIGFEALLRWNSADFGAVPPGRFIPIAESLGLMPELGLWVLDEACRQLRAWHDQGREGFTVAINFSAHQLQRPDVVQRVREALERHGIPGSMLEIELTESSLMENVDRVKGRLAELKALGVSLSLDDFGTGYSSLAYLKQFSLDKLKIDRSFVTDLPGDAADAAIARTIVAVGHELHMVVAAEGVENQAQADFLREMGCDELQGYHFGRPASASEIEALFPRD